MNERPFLYPLGVAVIMLMVALPSCRKANVDLALDLAQGDDVKKITLYSWDEYFNEELFEEFKDKHGIAIDYQKYANTDEVFQNLRSNGAAYDVIVLDDASMVRAKALRLLRPLDHAKIQNIQNIDPEFIVKAMYDPGLHYSVPYMWGTTLIAYRKDLVVDIEERWSVLFNPEYSGRVSVLDERMECFATALRVLGYPMNSGIESQLEEATSKLVSLVREQKAKLGSDNEMKRHLISGDSVIAMMYSGDAALIAEDHDIAFFIPDEGATRWTDSFAISRDSQSVDAAHLFINFMADAEIAARSSNALWYATPNLAAFNHPELNEELRNDETIYPPKEVMARCEFLADGDKERIKALNKGWDIVQSSRVDELGKHEDLSEMGIPAPIVGALDGEETAQ